MTQTETQAIRQRREEAVKQRAALERKAITYIDSDGCEVTVLPSGVVFYNVSEWW